MNGQKARLELLPSHHGPQRLGGGVVQASDIDGVGVGTGPEQQVGDGVQGQVYGVLGRSPSTTTSNVAGRGAVVARPPNHILAAVNLKGKGSSFKLTLKKIN